MPWDTFHIIAVQTLINCKGISQLLVPTYIAFLHHKFTERIYNDNCNFPMNPHARPLRCWLVGRSVIGYTSNAPIEVYPFIVILF